MFLFSIMSNLATDAGDEGEIEYSSFIHINPSYVVIDSNEHDVECFVYFQMDVINYRPLTIFYSLFGFFLVASLLLFLLRIKTIKMERRNEIISQMSEPPEITEYSHLFTSITDDEERETMYRLYDEYVAWMEEERIGYDNYADSYFSDVPRIYASC